MKQNSWLNTKTNQYYGTNTLLGSPRGWYQRAVGLKQPDLFLHPTTVDPGVYTVAGVWLRAHALPNSGAIPAFYRYFTISDNIRRFNDPKVQHMPAIGMAWSVRDKDILTVYNQFRESGAVWVWWDWPQEPKAKKFSEGKALDHDLLYEKFSAGMSSSEVADELDLLRPSVHYVYQKWQAGEPPNRKPRAIVDHSAVVQDLRLGRPVADIVAEHKCSRAMIYKIKGKYKVE